MSDAAGNAVLLARAVAKLDFDVLNRSASLLEWWRAQGNPQPLLFTLDELRSATDAFPIEIYDIRDCHRILYGSDSGGRSLGSQLAKVHGAAIPDEAKRLIFGENLKRMIRRR